MLLKLRVPTEIQLPGLVIPVKYVDTIPECGIYNYNTRHIKISTINHSSKEQVFDTLLHELIHAIFDHTGISKICVDVSENFEEMVVTALENYFRDNLLLSKKAWLKRSTVDFKMRDSDEH